MERGGEEIDRSEEREESEKSRSVSREDEGRGEGTDGEKSEGEGSVNVSDEERARSGPVGSVKRARLTACFTDEQELQIVEFVKEHPSFFSKTDPEYMDRYHREALWQQLAEEMSLEAVDVKRWWDTQRTRYGKLTKRVSGQAPKKLTTRQQWVCNQLGFLDSHIVRTQTSRSYGLESSQAHNTSRGSTTDLESVETSVRSQGSMQPVLTSTPATDARYIDLMEQTKTLISGLIEEVGLTPAFLRLCGL